MQQIGIDCRFSSLHGGLGTYTRSLVSALLLRSDPWATTLFVKNLSDPWLSSLPPDSARIIYTPFDHYSLAEQTALPNALQDAGCDLLLFPHFNVPLFTQTPFVCTVHDLILHRFPNESSLWKRLAYKFVLSSALRNARAVSCVSEYSKEELLRYYGSRVAAKTSVISPGVSNLFSPQSSEVQDKIRQKYSLHAPFLIYIGNAKEHKNTPVLLEAFAQSGLEGVELVLVTGGHESLRLVRMPNVRYLQNVDDEDLSALLSASHACVTATLLEGFCLPLIEAMACGTPVVATNTGPIPAITGGHAVLSDPSVDAFSAALRSIVLHPPSHQALSAARLWSQGYSWDIAAAETAALLMSSLQAL